MNLVRWMLTFLAFPIGGLLAIELIGSADDPVRALLGGLLAGAVLGLAQSLALQGGVDLRWVAATAAGLGAGAAIGVAVTGGGTELADLLVLGLISGLGVGLAQGIADAPLPLPGWTAVIAGAWTVGWLVTWAVGVDVERNYVVFGASGALTFAALTYAAMKLFGSGVVVAELGARA